MADWLDALERLQKLRLAGVLTDQEFEAEKRKLLGLAEPVETETAQSATLAALARLKKLQDDGILNDDEFEAERKRLVLDKPATTQSVDVQVGFNGTFYTDPSRDYGVSSATSGTPKAKGLSPMLVSFFVAFAILIAAVAYIQVHPELMKKPVTAAVGQMIVSASKLNCRSEPNTDSTIFSQLENGQEVTVVAQQSNWSRLDGTLGDCWVPSKFLSMASAPQAQPIDKNPTRVVLQDNQGLTAVITESYDCWSIEYKPDACHTIEEAEKSNPDHLTGLRSHHVKYLGKEFAFVESWRRGAPSYVVGAFDWDKNDVVKFIRVPISFAGGDNEEMTFSFKSSLKPPFESLSDPPADLDGKDFVLQNSKR